MNRVTFDLNRISVQISRSERTIFLIASFGRLGVLFAKFFTLKARVARDFNAVRVVFYRRTNDLNCV